MHELAARFDIVLDVAFQTRVEKMLERILPVEGDGDLVGTENF